MEITINLKLNKNTVTTKMIRQKYIVQYQTK